MSHLNNEITDEIISILNENVIEFRGAMTIKGYLISDRSSTSIEIKDVPKGKIVGYGTIENVDGKYIWVNGNKYTEEYHNDIDKLKKKIWRIEMKIKRLERELKNKKEKLAEYETSMESKIDILEKLLRDDGD